MFLFSTIHHLLAEQVESGLSKSGGPEILEMKSDYMLTRACIGYFVWDDYLCYQTANQSQKRHFNFFKAIIKRQQIK